MAFGLAVYASQGRLPDTTQDSLPVAGQALLDGIPTRKVPMKGFKFVVYISFPFPKLSWRNRCNLGEFFIPKGCKRLAPGRAAHPGVLTRKQGSPARVPAKAGTRAGDGFV